MRRFKGIILLAVTCLFLQGVTGQSAFINYTTADGLPDDNVMGVTVDFNGDKWFATQAGVARLAGTTWTVWTTSNGLADNYIKCISVSTNGYIWAGTDVGVSVFNGTTWTNLNTTNGLVDNMVNCIYGTDNGDVWIGTTGGLSKYSGGTFTNYTTTSGLPSNMVSCIAESIFPTADLYFGTWMGGLVKYNGTTFTTINAANNALPDDNITCLAIDSNGYKYVGTYFGLAKLNPQNQCIDTLLHVDGLLNEYIRDVRIAGIYGIWVGMFADYIQEGGISMMSNGNPAGVFTYTPAHGLVSVFVNCIAIDLNNDAWIATGSGVSKFSFNQLSVDAPEMPVSGAFFYPNPAKEQLYLQLDGHSRGICRITDPAGRLMLAQDVGPEQQTLYTGNLKPGVYLVELTTNAHTSSGKLIIQ
ncbi:MAG TPA: two-component regulator propeller domain-containing protein [Bacteroidales bacterium]|nr:two-component regulator propeller domain-containing protein [Bacteroidales bacterium]